MMSQMSSPGRYCYTKEFCTSERARLIQGHLEKLLSLTIADSTGVNVNESERERSGIIRTQFCGVRKVGAIFRGALKIRRQFCPAFDRRVLAPGVAFALK
jgi:hypothetical protein